MPERNTIPRAGLLLPVVLCLWASAGGGLLAQPAAPQPALEYQVKAAFLVNFTKFIEWPPSAFSAPDSAFTICILGEDPFAGVLDAMIQGESVNGHAVTLRRLREPPAAHTCHLLYIGGSAAKDASGKIRSLGPGVLAVGEGDAFLREGGTIAFVVDNRRVRFDVNRVAADTADLRLSSRLLSVARSVKED